MRTARDVQGAKCLNRAEHESKQIKKLSSDVICRRSYGKQVKVEVKGKKKKLDIDGNGKYM